MDPKTKHRTIEDTSEGSTQSRRSALKKILVVCGMTTGLSSLPSRWTQPIIDQVLVPAHAATSPCVNDQLVIPEESIQCGPPNNTAKSTYYGVDDSNCPATLITSDTFISSRTPVFVQHAATVPPVESAAVGVVEPNFFHVQIATNCRTGVDPQLPGGPFAFPFKSTTGSDWEATGTLSGDITGYVVSDIILSPL